MKNSRKPVIGVLPLYDEERESLWMLPGYMRGIEAAGGAPVMLSLWADANDIAYWADTLDGFLFTGGQDVDPTLYGEERNAYCEQICALRDRLESRLFQLVCYRDKPVLGICRGLQIINVLLGGTLYQDIPTQLAAEKRIVHSQPAPFSQPCHSVHVAADSLLGKQLGCSTLQVNSLHHQGIKTLAKGLCAAATAEDGLVEAVYMPEKQFVLAVQWHPECSYEQDKDALALFRLLVDAAQ